MKLPEFFVVQRDESNPLWGEYLKWLNKTYKQIWSGTGWSYYGYDGNKGYNGTNTWDRIDCFEGNPVQLSLEQWDKLVNFPEKWCIRQTLSQEVCDWFAQNTMARPHLKGCFKYLIYPMFIGGGYYSEKIPQGYREITVEQFKKYIMNDKSIQEAPVKETRKIIAYKSNKKVCQAKLEHLLDTSWSQPDDISFSVGSLTWKRAVELKVLDIWFDPVYEEEKIMLDGSSYQIRTYKEYATIDGHIFSKSFWEAAKIIAEHTYGDVVVGCGAKAVRGSAYRWSVSLETIKKVLSKL